MKTCRLFIQSFLNSVANCAGISIFFLSSSRVQGAERQMEHSPGPIIQASGNLSPAGRESHSGNIVEAILGIEFRVSYLEFFL